MVDFWSTRRFLVTGASGFLGSHVMEAMRARGARYISQPLHSRFDLRERDAIRTVLEAAEADIVIHLAANVGGIQANRERPADFLYDNLSMGMHLMRESHAAGVAKFVTVGTVCSYPKFTPVPFREESLWDGYPEETNAPYGIAKKVLLVQGQALRDQHGFNAIYLLPTNLYGPRDNFDPKTSHVIPALIRKAQYAKDHGDPQLPVWGSGAASREFLYVKDCAEAICEATEHYDEREPVNLGTGEEIKIRDLVEKIVKEVGYRGGISWDHTKPDGQPRRSLDTSRAKQAFGWEASTPFDEGLRCTVEWFSLVHSKEHVFSGD